MDYMTENLKMLVQTPQKGTACSYPKMAIQTYTRLSIEQ